MTDNSIHLLVAGEPATGERMRSALARSDAHYLIECVPSAEAVHRLLPRQRWRLIFSELELTDCNALELHAELRRNGFSSPMVLIAGSGGEDLALQGVQNGIVHCILNNDDYLKRLPFIIQNLIRASSMELQRREAEERLRDSEERYLDIFDNTSDLIQCLASDGRFLYTNRAWRETMGYTEEEVASLILPDVLHPDSMICCSDRFERLKQGETLKRIEFKFITKSGDTVYLAGECGSIIKNGEAISTRGIFKNISGEIRKEKALLDSETRYQSLYENAPDINAILDRNLMILSVNKIGANMLGYEVRELVGRSAVETIYPEDRAGVITYLERQFEKIDISLEHEYRKLRKDGSRLWVQMRVSQVLEPDDENRHLLVVCRDINETKKLSRQLLYQATHDGLTNLINRREFETRLAKIISDDTKKGERHALCFLDLDQFKIINDACGHLAGDELLRQVSEALASQVRSRDTLARLGGDEFAVLMEHCTIEQAEQLANRFQKFIEDFRFHWNTRRFSIGVSIGVVEIDENATSIEQIMNYADSACFAAKEAGRNRVYVYRPDDAIVEHYTGEMQWASRISLALEQNRFMLYAQPIFSAEDPNINGSYEILVRLKDTPGKIVRPGSFLAAAERFNLSNKLDKWVLGSTLKWFSKQQSALNSLVSCSINLSGLSLSDESVLEFVEDTLEKTGFPCEKLCLEITETAAISNLPRAINFINRLKTRGCHFALDDFGSGLSSYGYLKNLPVDVIKIDGIFVQNIENNDIDRAVVKSICEIATLMGKKTTAEYVESSAALDILRDFGVSYVQGNFLGAPLPLSLAVLAGKEAGDQNLGTL